MKIKGVTNIEKNFETAKELQIKINELEQSARIEAEQSALEWYFGSGWNEKIEKN